jgi:hypothetical protein
MGIDDMITAREAMDEAGTGVRKFRANAVIILGGLSLAILVGLGIDCKSSDSKPPPPPPPPVKVTQTGRITDIFSKQPISGVTIAGADSTVTTNANGEYTFTYTKGTAPVLTMDKAGYVTRTTFPAHGPDYHNIPDGFNMAEFDKIVRPGGKTQRWSFDPARKPVFYITSYTQDPVPKDLKNRIRDVILNDLPKISSIFGGAEIKDEPDFSKVPKENAFVFCFSKSGTGAGCHSDDNGYLRYYAEVALGGSDAWGDDNTINITRSVIVHEAGHGVGFNGHATNQKNSVMFQGNGPSSLTQLDIQNGTVLYDRPAGNSSPDNDPSAVASVAMEGVTSFEQMMDNEGPDLSDPLGTRMFLKPREWMLYERELQRAKMVNDKQLMEYEQERVRAVRERH